MGIAGWGTRGAHIEHGSHARDLRRIKAAKRLVEHMRGLPSHNTAGGRTMRSEVRAGRRKSVHAGWLRRRWTGVHGEQGPIKAGGGQVTSGAHVEHPAHVRDLGRIEAAKRLVERFRVLPSQRERAYESERGTGRGRRKGEGTLVAAHKRCARRGGADSRLVGGQGASGAHLEHPGHVRDLGGVEAAERLVERQR